MTSPPAAGRRTGVLVTIWVIALGLAILCASVFAAGVARDTRVGEPTIDLSLGTPSDWTHSRFRPWRNGRYRLFVSTVNHDPQRVGTRFEGALDVSVQRPDGTTHYARTFTGDTMPHVVPDNYGDTELAHLELDGAMTHPWTLSVRISTPDQDFVGLRSQVKLWRERNDVGMGGLINYVMIVPAGVFAAVALLVSLPLARRGVRTPVIITGGALLAVLLWSAI